MMKTLFKAVAAVAAVMGVGFSLAPAKEMPTLAAGDIVFQTTSTSASNAIMLASGTRYTHVGLVSLNKTGKPSVIEAVGPVREVPLEKWIKHGKGGLVTVKRIKGLTEEQANQAITSARSYLGRPYDNYFYETLDEIYCSELIHVAFKDGPGLTVGKEEKVRDLNIDTGAAQKLIRTRWKSHPLCKSEGAKSFDACYQLILEQKLVTPASIARDPQVEEVYTNYGWGAD
jgi:uncharacterized protein YycO